MKLRFVTFHGHLLLTSKNESENAGQEKRGKVGKKT